MSLGPGELVVIVLVVVMLFGARRLAALGKGIGEGIREFKRGISGSVEQGKSDSVAKPPNVTATARSVAAVASDGTTPCATDRDPTGASSPPSDAGSASPRTTQDAGRP